eukprot:347464-Chlamydomonas_euryale.AAC.7
MRRCERAAAGGAVGCAAAARARRFIRCHGAAPAELEDSWTKCGKKGVTYRYALVHKGRATPRSLPRLLEWHCTSRMPCGTCPARWQVAREGSGRRCALNRAQTLVRPCNNLQS